MKKGGIIYRKCRKCGTIRNLNEAKKCPICAIVKYERLFERRNKKKSLNKVESYTLDKSL